MSFKALLYAKQPSKAFDLYAYFSVQHLAFVGNIQTELK